MPDSFVVPLGNTRELSTALWWVRTRRQFRVIQQIVESQEFDFACANPLQDDNRLGIRRDKPITFMYYTKDGVLHVKRIGTKGRILNHIVDGQPVASYLIEQPKLGV